MPESAVQPLLELQQFSAVTTALGSLGQSPSGEEPPPNTHLPFPWLHTILLGLIAVITEISACPVLPSWCCVLNKTRDHFLLQTVLLSKWTLAQQEPHEIQWQMESPTPTVQYCNIAVEAG